MRKRQLIICPNPEKEVDKLIARKDFLLKRGEKLNRGSIQFLKDMNDRGERKRLMKKLLDAELPLSNNAKRDLEIGAEIYPLPLLLPPYAVDWLSSSRLRSVPLVALLSIQNDRLLRWFFWYPKNNFSKKIWQKRIFSLNDINCWGCGTYRYHAKGNVTKEIRMKNATPSKGGKLAQTLELIRKGEPINLGSVAYLKTIKNLQLKRELIRKLYYSELQMSGNLSRYFEEFLDLRKPREKERRKWTHPYLCSDWSFKNWGKCYQGASLSKKSSSWGRFFSFENIWQK